MDYCVHLDVFEGPLDLLLHLLDQERLDIHDIEIASITQQYLDYLATMHDYDLEVTGDFLVMAATLLQIKAGALLPDVKPDNLEDDGDTIYSRDDLIRRLLVYRQFRDMADEFRQMAEIRLQALPRPFSSLGLRGPSLYTNPIGNATVQDLAKALGNALGSWREREQVRQIQRREIDLGVRIGQIRLFVQEHSRIAFDDLLGSRPSRTEIIFTFLAVLELVRQGAVKVRQRDISGPITIVLDQSEPEQLEEMPGVDPQEVAERGT
ncbi:MAG: segregation/condensation protein A [Firmicutes bacterium]|nr:segregation/condensation protein A [Bacillota bacterium]